MAPCEAAVCVAAAPSESGHKCPLFPQKMWQHLVVMSLLLPYPTKSKPETLESLHNMTWRFQIRWGRECFETTWIESCPVK